MTITSVEQAAPGAPDEVERAASQLVALADSIDGARRQVKDLVDGISRGGDVLRGAAATAFADQFEDLPRDLQLFSTTAHDVGTALKGWSGTVRGLQDEARRALARYEAGQRRRDTASAQVSALASRLGLLRNAISATEARASGHLKDHKRQALLGQQEQANQSYQLYLMEFRAKTPLQNDWNSADWECNQQRQDQQNAESEMRSAQGGLEGILDRHGDHDRQTAKAIEAALPQALKNKSNLEKLGHWAADQLEKAGEWLADFADTYLDMIDALLDGDWDRAVFRFREVVDKFTQLLGPILAVLCVVALFIPIPGLNVLLAAALVLAIARFASTGFLLARDADDPDHPGKKAASLTELVMDGITVAAAAVALKFPPQVKGNSSWASGGRQFLKGEKATGLLKFTPEGLREPVAVLMKAHPGFTNVLEGTKTFIVDKYVKPKVEDYVIKGLAHEGHAIIGMDEGDLVTTLTIANDGRKVAKSYHDVTKVPDGQYYKREIKTRKAIKTSVSSTKDVLKELEKRHKEKASAVPSGGGGGGAW